MNDFDIESGDSPLVPASKITKSSTPSIDDIIPDAEAEVTKVEDEVEADVVHPAHSLLTEVESFFDTFEIKSEEDLDIAKGWIKLQVSKIKALL